MFKTIILNNEFAKVPLNKIWYVVDSTITLSKKVFSEGEAITGTGEVVVSEFDSTTATVEPVISPTPTVGNEFNNGWARFAYPESVPEGINFTMFSQAIFNNSELNISSFNIDGVVNANVTAADVSIAGDLRFTLDRIDNDIEFDYSGVELGLSDGTSLFVDPAEMIPYTPRTSGRYLLGDNLPSEITVPVTIPSLDHNIDIDYPIDLEVYGNQIKSTSNYGYNTACSVSGTTVSGTDLSFSGNVRTDSTIYPDTDNNFFVFENAKLSSQPFTVDSSGVHTVGVVSLGVRLYNFRNNTTTVASYSRDITVKVDVTVE